MGQTITLSAKDGFKPTAYEAKPSGKARGGLVMVQEIFGVNNHMKRTADVYAAAGYHVVAPGFFDRVGKDIQLGYGEADIAKGREIRGKLNWDQILADVQAGIDALKGAGKLGIIGYCFGGSVAWLGATRFKDFSASVCFYGGNIAQFSEEKPNCPVQMHFGEKDQSIPMTDVEAIRAAQPNVEVFVYPGAEHGFGCDERGSFSKPDADLAQQRTLAFFASHLG